MAADIERGGLGMGEESSGILRARKSNVHLVTRALTEDLDQSSASNGGSDLGMSDASRGEKNHGVVDMLAGNEIIT